MASFTAQELREAAREFTPAYRGIVLAAAIEIVQRKLDISLSDLAREMYLNKHTLSNWRQGKPLANAYHFERNMEKLARVLRCE